MSIVPHRDSNAAEELLTIHDLPFKVAEWTDEAGFQAIAAKYIRLRPHAEIEKNKTYIVTTIVVRNCSYNVYRRFCLEVN